MQTVAAHLIPQHITATRNGRVWPPNRPAIVTEATKNHWEQQRPGGGQRPMPIHFRRAFIILGWRECEWYFSANWRCTARWLNECGKADTLRERAAMRRDPQRPALKAAMASNYRCEPSDQVWFGD